MTMSRPLLLILKLLATLALVAWIAFRIDLSELLAGIAAIRPRTWFLIASLHFGVVLLLGVRLALTAGERWPPIILLTLKAQFFQLAPPAQIGGDVYRVWALTRLSQSTHIASAFTVAADRILGLLVLVAYALSAIFLVDRGSESLRIFAHLNATALVWYGVILIISAAASAVLVWRYRAQSRLQSVLHELARVLRRLGLPQVGAAIALSLLMYGLICIIAALVMFDLAMLDVAAAFSVPPVIFLVTMAVPISISGVGVREAAGIFLYGLFGYPPADALVLASAPFMASLSAALVGFVLVSFGRGSPSRHKWRS